MQSPILIRPPLSGQPGDQHWQWASRGEGTHEGTLQACAKWIQRLGGRHDVVLAIPAEQVLLSVADMPSSNTQRISRALPFALEDQLLEDPAQLHCVAGPRLSEQQLAAGVINASLLKGWLDEMAAEDIAPVCAVADALCLPWHEDEIHQLKDGERTLIRWGRCKAMATDGDAGVHLDIIGSEIPAAKQVTHTPDSGHTALELLLDNVADNPVNFLQGKFLPVIKQAGWNAWRWPLTLAAACLVLALVLQGLVNFKLEREGQRLETEIRTQFAEIFPEIQRVQIDPAPQIEMELRKLRGAGTENSVFLTLMQASAPLVATSPGVVLERIHYRDARLELGLSAGQMSELEGLRLRLVSAGVEARQGATRLDGGRVSGSMLITRASAGAGR
jgi:general secretion pathway protein L